MTNVGTKMPVRSGVRSNLAIAPQHAAWESGSTLATIAARRAVNGGSAPAGAPGALAGHPGGDGFAAELAQTAAPDRGGATLVSRGVARRRRRTRCAQAGRSVGAMGCKPQRDHPSHTEPAHERPAA